MSTRDLPSLLVAHKTLVTRLSAISAQLQIALETGNQDEYERLCHQALEIGQEAEKLGREALRRMTELGEAAKAAVSMDKR